MKNYEVVSPRKTADLCDNAPIYHYGLMDQETGLIVGFFARKSIADRCAAALNAPKFPMKIVEFIREGEIVIDKESRDKLTTQDLINTAGRMMDRACTYDILGDVVFRCEDNQVYVMNIEAEIGLINPDYLKQLREEDREEE